MEKVEEIGLKIPFSSLNEDTLEGIIKDFVLREGTDYGDREYSLAEKIEQVKTLLLNGEVEIVFDPVSETCSVVRRFDFIR